MKKLFCAALVLLLVFINIDAEAMRLKGDGIKEVHRYMHYIDGDSHSEIYDNILKVSTYSFYPYAAPEYNLDIDEKNTNLYFYKKGIGGTPVVLGVKGINLELENLTNDVIVIKWNDSLVQLGEYSGLPFFDGMKYIDAGRASMLQNTVIPPLAKKEISVFLANVEYQKGDAFNSSGWKDGYAPLMDYKPLDGLLCLRVEVNNQDKYYTFKLPRIELPKYIVEKYEYRN